MKRASRDAIDVAGAQVTLVEGASFCVSGPSGDLQGRGQGLFVSDTRILSTWVLQVDGQEVEPLAATRVEPFEAEFVGRAAVRPGQVEPTVVVERHRYVGAGMREDITLRNYGHEPAGVEVRLLVDCDFADLFEVKENRPIGGRPVQRRAVGSDLVLWTEHGDGRGVRVSAAEATATEQGLRFATVVPAHGSWSARVEVVASISGAEIEAPFPLHEEVEQTAPARRMQGWRDSIPDITVEDPALSRALSRSEEDLGALRIVDPAYPEDDVVAAGAPWFMALFGRDSLITGWMTLPFSPDLTMGTLRTLARMQGKVRDDMSEEEPGRILHEVRRGADLSQALGGHGVYYGSIDSTPLFLMLLGRALQWGVPWEQIEPLLGHAQAAARWILEHGDRDGDGFVEYQRTSDRGLLNQGWKDSADSICFADGRPAHGPIALAEVQGYCYAALLAMAQLEERRGDDRAASRWREHAGRLRERFHEAFWMPDQQYYALALDGDKRQVDAIASNAGHCLWTGIVPDEFAGAVADRLLSPEMFTGFGIRTLATTSARYNPVSYHNGSVWPHDSAICAAGLARYGFSEHAQRVSDGLLDAATAFDGRLPELFCGFDRSEQQVPVRYPTSCSPQAWAAAVPFELLRIALKLEPSTNGLDVGATPNRVGSVSIDKLPFEQRSHSVRADRSSGTVTSEHDTADHDAAAQKEGFR